MNNNPNIGWYFYRELLNNYEDSKATIDIGHSKIKVSKYDWSALHIPNKNNNKRKKMESNNTAIMKVKTAELFKLKDLTANEHVNLKDNNFISAEQCFELKTTYPGLLIGSGYEHETGITEELKLGFFFDHTTGLPVIPGSSVKGVLKNAFDHADFIKDFLTNKDYMGDKALDESEVKSLNIEKLKDEIFNNKIMQDGKEAYLTPYKRDIFHDTFIIESQYTGNNNQQDKGRILGNDYITPHINTEKPEMTPFTEPKPLQFLKVLPNVIFAFQFDLKDSQTNPKITAIHKKLLFKTILLTLGIGAKTNVGYGQFEEIQDT